MGCFTPNGESRGGADHPHPSVGERRDARAGIVRYPIVIAGYVEHGRKLGRALGAPTANIPLVRCPPYLAGSYAAEVTGLDRVYQGCAHLGVCPSVGGTVAGLETHLFDLDADIYGAFLSVRLLYRVSNELKLDSLAELERKISRDLAACRRFFAASGVDPVGVASLGRLAGAGKPGSSGWGSGLPSLPAFRRPRPQP